MKDVVITARRWKRVEYERLVETGTFQSDDRIELVGGRLIVAEPKGTAHVAAVEMAADALRATFGSGWHVRVQNPIALDDESEPDLAVVRGSARDYATGHPSHPVLVVEVAETSLVTDRVDKASLYGRAHVADYWRTSWTG
jgi:Uma2 family endonuclease